MLLPTRGTLGRRAMPGSVEPSGVARGVRVVVEESWRFPVERSRAAALQSRLDRIHRRHADALVWNPGSRLGFVPHPEAYSYFHNSNHVAAGWLRELGCEVEGPAFASRWAVERAEDESSLYNPDAAD